MGKNKDKTEVSFHKEKSEEPNKLWSSLRQIFKIPRWRQADEVALVLFAAFVIATTLFYFNQWKFSEEAWKRAPGSRHEIVDDLINSKILKDKSKVDVLSILGEPYYYDENSDILKYGLGVPASFSEEKFEYLIIRFEYDIVAEISVETD